MPLQQKIEAGFAAIEDADGLDELASRIQGVVNRVTSDRRVKNLLSGVPLGHPAHPPMTDVPIGAFTSAALLDVLPGRVWARRGADTLIATGIVATLPTVATGLNDWADTSGASQRLGLVHAWANGAATVLYTVSLGCRATGRRSSGVATGMLGWVALTVGGTLGGHLAYRRGLGVDENAFTPQVEDWRPAIAEHDLPERVPTAAEVDGISIVLYRTSSGTFAIADRCSHHGGPLSDGEVDDDLRIRCPWHASDFALTDGAVIRGPASAPQPAFETRVVEGTIEVRQRAR